MMLTLLTFLLLVSVAGSCERFGPIQHYGGKCIHPYGGKPHPSLGTPIVTYSGCNEDRLQFCWTSSGAIKHLTSGLCVQPRGGRAGKDTTLVLDRNCGASYARWRFTAGGSIKHVSSGYCWHPYGGSSHPVNNNVVVSYNLCDERRIRFTLQDTCYRHLSAADFTATDVVYDVLKGVVKPLRPEIVAYQRVDNVGGTSDQTTTFTASEEVTETASFTRTAGSSVTVGTEFTAKIPLVGEASVSAELTASMEFSSGKENSNTKTMEAQFECTGAPGKITDCIAMLFKYKVSVPYTMTWKHKRFYECTCIVKGLFEELSANRMSLVVTEE